MNEKLMERAMKTIIGIQDEYIQAVIAGASRWSHRQCPWDAARPGGHFTRIRRGAHTRAMKSLKALGFADDIAEKIISDAMDVAKLEINAE